jgi:hypothetical protein
MKCNRFQHLTALTRELGVLNAGLYLFDRVLRRLGREAGLYHYVFVAQPLSMQPRLLPARGKSFSFHCLTQASSLLDTLERPASIIHSRFDQGAECLAATRNGALVGCIWFARRRYAEDEVRVDYVLPDAGTCVWDFDVHVAPSERLGFLFARQWDAFDALLKPQGVNYSVSRINAFNQRSLASHRSLGAQDCGRALFFRWGACQLMLASMRPFVAIGGRPQLRIEPRPTPRS